MNHKQRNRLLIFTGLGSALAIAIVLSPFASRNPDGLDRVSQDLQFEHKATENFLAERLPFRHWFEEYSLKGVPSAIATPLAGAIGTLTAFALAWGVGKLLIPASPDSATDASSDSEQP